MGLGRSVYLPTFTVVDLYGFHVGKYTVHPMDPAWVVVMKTGCKFGKTH